MKKVKTCVTYQTLKRRRQKFQRGGGSSKSSKCLSAFFVCCFKALMSMYSYEKRRKKNELINTTACIIRQYIQTQIHSLAYGSTDDDSRLSGLLVVIAFDNNKMNMITVELLLQ